MKHPIKEKIVLLVFGILFLHLGCFHLAYLSHGPSLALLETTQWSYNGWFSVNIIILVLEVIAGIMFLLTALDF